MDIYVSIWLRLIGFLGTELESSVVCSNGWNISTKVGDRLRSCMSTIGSCLNILKQVLQCLVGKIQKRALAPGIRTITTNNYDGTLGEWLEKWWWGLGERPSNDEITTAISAAAEVTRSNQVTATSETDPGDASGPAIPDMESAFATKACDTPTTHTTLISMCCNVDVIAGPTQEQETNMTYMSKVQTIQDLHYCFENIAPERLQYLVENGQ